MNVVGLCTKFVGSKAFRAIEPILWHIFQILGLNLKIISKSLNLKSFIKYGQITVGLSSVECVLCQQIRDNWAFEG